MMTIYLSKVQIGIDPGISGGIAFVDEIGRYWVENMPDTVGDLVDMLSDLDIKFAMVEKVGTYMPGNSGPASVKFARHCGMLDGVLSALRIPHGYVAPQMWMKDFIGKPPKDKTERKNKIKQCAQELFPNLKITLKTSDALGILCYHIRQNQF